MSKNYSSILETLAKTDEKLARCLKVSNSIQRQNRIIQELYETMQKSSIKAQTKLWNSIQNPIKASNQKLLDTYRDILCNTPTEESNIDNGEVYKDLPIDDNYVSVSESSIKEFKVPDELVIPLGHNRVIISLSLLLTIIGIIVSITLGIYGADSKNQEEQIQVLYEILESVEPLSNENELNPSTPLEQ